MLTPRWLILLLGLALATYFWHRPNHHRIYEVIPLPESSLENLAALGLSQNHPVKITHPDGSTQLVHGRFIHVTDFHPDIYYKEGSLTLEMCHSGSDGTALKYGDAVLGCDSPMILFNETVLWIKKNLHDKIDFIIWTGDNIRHDNDRNYPRSENAIFESNHFVAQRLIEAFHHENSLDPNDMTVQLIPSLGNNDVYPHNLFAPGPTLQTRELFRVWRNFIPASQAHVFSRGAYYFKEVIPDQLAVLLINTLYLFDLNPLVDDCDNKKDPGYKLFQWLGVVLEEMRARGIKIWLSGHVPPNEKNYDISCLRKYVVWIHEYRDVIIGGLFGHMNIDHFLAYDSVAAYKSIEDDFGDQKISSFTYDGSAANHDDTEAYGATDYWKVFNENFDKDWFRIQGGIPKNKVLYLELIREDVYSKVKLKKKLGKHGERYLVALVGTLIIPTFNPGFRVYEYNILTLSLSSVVFAPWDKFFAGVDQMMDMIPEEGEINIMLDPTFPPKMPKKLQLGPAYTPQLFSPTRFTQYYLDLELVNEGYKDFGYEIEYKLEDVGLDSLLVSDFLDYARRLGEGVETEELKVEEEVDIEGKKGKKKKGKKSKKGKKGKNGKGKKPDTEKTWAQYLKHAFALCDYENMDLG